MNVYISGATGYMGKALTASLLGRGHGVRALVHLPTDGWRVIDLAGIRGAAGL